VKGVVDIFHQDVVDRCHQDVLAQTQHGLHRQSRLTLLCVLLMQVTLHLTTRCVGTQVMLVLLVCMIQATSCVYFTGDQCCFVAAKVH